MMCALDTANETIQSSFLSSLYIILSYQHHFIINETIQSSSQQQCSLTCARDATCIGLISYLYWLNAAARDVNMDSILKAKARTKDWSFKAKTRINDFSFVLKDNQGPRIRTTSVACATSIRLISYLYWLNNYDRCIGLRCLYWLMLLLLAY